MGRSGARGNGSAVAGMGDAGTPRSPIAATVALFRALHKYSFWPEMMKRLVLVCLLSIVALGLQAEPPVEGEYIMLVGGQSMCQWEKYKTVPQDTWWGKFLCDARLREEQLYNVLGVDD